MDLDPQLLLDDVTVACVVHTYTIMHGHAHAAPSDYALCVYKLLNNLEIKRGQSVCLQESIKFKTQCIMREAAEVLQQLYCNRRHSLLC